MWTSSITRRAAGLSLLASLLAPRAALAEPVSAEDDARLAGPIDRAVVERVAVARSPALREARHLARAARATALADGAAPPPEAMAQLWQVPLSRPLAVGDAQMAMVGLAQTFTPAGVRPQMEEARGHEARARDAGVDARARELRAAVGHAFVDYAEAVARHRAHDEHHMLVTRALEVARARQAAASGLVDVAQTELELARLEADLAREVGAVEAARARLNGLLGRPTEAALGPPVDDEAPAVAVAADAGVADRAEVREAEAMAAGAVAMARAADREASIPEVKLAALYFAPVGPMPAHGFGIDLTISLPWLSGAGHHKADAERARADAERARADDERQRARTELGVARASVVAADRRLSLLTERGFTLTEERVARA